MLKRLPILLLSLIFLQCSASTRTYKEKIQQITPSGNVRVLLEEKITTLTFLNEFPVIIRYKNKDVITIDAGQRIQINYAEGKIEVRAQRKKIILSSLVLLPADIQNLISYQGNSYRGELRVEADGSSLKLINILGLEDYIKGVMQPEMGVAKNNDDFQALKAFAVCVRTYTLNKIAENKPLFDVYPDKRDQIYIGTTHESEFAASAVSGTKGQVLKYNGQLAKVFYFSSCGGRTEKSDNVFKGKDLPYLQSIKDGDEPNCKISPSYSWIENFSASDIINCLTDANLAEGKSCELKNINIKNRFPSGRVDELVFTLAYDGGEEKEVVVAGNHIRSVIKPAKGGGILKSTMFFLTLNKNTRGSIERVMISGTGNGHGVGFCQWGAIGLSRKGTDYKKILEFYFKDTQLGEINV